LRLVIVAPWYVKSAYRRMGIGRQLLNHATNGSSEFVAVLAQSTALRTCRDRGLLATLSPLLS
jgi:GNAT superfamily N-acetyltransferase